MDAEGKPAEGATVVVERLRKPGDGKSDLPRRSDSMVAWSDVGPDEEQDWWEAIQELETKADADGGFVVHQHPTEAGYRLTAKAYPQKDVSQLITPGEQDIQLQLGAPSTVVGKVLLDRAIAKHGIQVQLRYPNDRLSRGYSSHGTVLYPDGSFRFNIERDAVVTLAAVAENSDEEFFLMEDLALDAEGGLHSIPDIDLRGALHQIVLSIEDENGIRLKEGQIGRPGAEDLEFFHAQPLILVSRSAAFDFEIQCDGWRKEVRTGVTSNERVVLRKGIPIQVQVTNLGILHEDWDLSTTILPADLDLDENQYHRDSVNLRLDADGVGNALVHSPGPYRVRYTILHARNKAPSTSWWHPVESNPDAPVLEILDLDETQQFLISIDPLLLEEAMRASDLKAAERLAEYEANQKR